MQFRFTEQQLLSARSVLLTTSFAAQNVRRVRRAVRRLADKFTANARYVHLRPEERFMVSKLLGNARDFVASKQGKDEEEQARLDKDCAALTEVLAKLERAK